MRHVTRSGWRRAKRRVERAPSEVPPIDAEVHFIASRTAPTSSAIAGGEIMDAAVSPWPRWSKATQEKRAPSTGAAAEKYAFEKRAGCARSSGGPSPNWTQARSAPDDEGTLNGVRSIPTIYHGTDACTSPLSYLESWPC